MFTLTFFKQITREIRAVIMRFPLAMVAAFLGTTIGILFVEAGEPAFYIRPLMVLALGFPLFLALIFLSEDRQFGKSKKILINSVAIIFLAIYYFLLPYDIENAELAHIISYLLWVIGFVLLVTFISFLKKGNESIQAFWQFNKILVYSLVLAVMWAVAIQAGISIALASIDFLFKIDIPGDRYVELWIVIVGIFGTMFFLSRVPQNLSQTVEIEEYPKELRLFSQYVLVPLVVLYFLILYAYVVRILVMWEWPEGTLAHMILGFSLLGVFVYVCMYPLRASVSWIRRGGVLFYLALVPQVGMLFWALWFRIAQYGFTENRYFVFVFGFWLLAIALYFLLSKQKDIRIIPITLFCIALFSSFGPWGTFAVSERSQVNRIETILMKNHLIEEGKVKKAKGDISLDDKKEISAIVRYLHDTHGLDSMEHLFGEKLSLLNYKREVMAEKITEDLIGIEYLEEWEGISSDDTYFYFHKDSKVSDSIITISKYDYIMLDFTRKSAQVGNSTYYFDIDNAKGVLVFRRDARVLAEISLKLFLEDLMKGGKENINPDRMKLEFENENVSLVLFFNSISGQKKEAGAYQIDSISGILLFSPR